MRNLVFTRHGYKTSWCCATSGTLTKYEGNFFSFFLMFTASNFRGDAIIWLIIKFFKEKAILNVKQNFAKQKCRLSQVIRRTLLPLPANYRQQAQN